MKFGTYFVSKQVEEWKEHYLNYKELDKMVRALTEVERVALPIDIGQSGFGERTVSTTTSSNSGNSVIFNGKKITEIDFFNELEKNMANIDEFTSKELNIIKADVEGLVQETSSIMDNDLDKEKRESLLSTSTKIGERFLKLEKFVNMNYLGFHKILKKHDKQLPNTPCAGFYLSRLHHQRWISSDYSTVFMNLSHVHDLLRDGISIAPSIKKSKNLSKYVSKYYWVRTENISVIKHFLLQHLPVTKSYEDVSTSSDSEKEGVYDSSLSNTVYFDNTQMELYHKLLETDGMGSSEIFIRWYGTSEPKVKVFVTRVQLNVNANGEEILQSQDQFVIRPYQVLAFIRGDFTVEDYKNELELKKESADFIKDKCKLFAEIQKQFDSKQVQPILRAVTDRVTFGVENQHNVIASLDTNISLFKENPSNGKDCYRENRWFRNPKYPLDETETTKFPHGVLKISVLLDDDNIPMIPDWLEDIESSGKITLVGGFSKYLHGSALLLNNVVQKVPFWMEDESIQYSIKRLSSMQGFRRFKDDDEGEIKSGSKSRGTSIDLLHKQKGRNHNSVTGYGTIPENDDKSLSDPLGLHQDNADISFGEWCCNPFFKNSNYHDTIPLKLEPKVFMANERLLISWLQMAVSISSIGIGLVGFVGNKNSQHGGEKSAHLIGMILMPVSILFTSYAISTFYWRGQRIRYRKEEMHDESGSLLLGAVLLVAMCSIFFLDLFIGHAPAPKGLFKLG